MLYEKTLARKIIGTRKDAAIEDVKDVNGRETPTEETVSSNFFRRASHGLRRFLRRSGIGHLKKSQEDIKQPASMGKILNLMRQVARFDPLQEYY